MKALSNEAAMRLLRDSISDVKTIEPYPGSNKKLWSLECPECGGEWKTTLSRVVNQGARRCGACAGNRKYSDEAARAIVTAALGEIEFTEVYPGNANAPWAMKCPSCNGRWAPPLSQIVKGGKTCGPCAAKRRAVSSEDAVNVVLSLFPEMVIRGEYPERVDAPWHMTCPKCGGDWFPRLNDLRDGRVNSRCGTCSRNEGKFTDEEARSIVRDLVPQVEFLETYPGSTNASWAMRCPTCEETRRPSLHSIKDHGQGICGDCAVTGFDRGKRGVVYDTQGDWGYGEVRMFGISNVPTSRLATHRRTGFDRSPQHLVSFESGQDAWLLERSLLALMKEYGIPSCSQRGLVFDGSTEAFFMSDATDDFVCRYLALLEQR